MNDIALRQQIKGRQPDARAVFSSPPPARSRYKPAMLILIRGLPGSGKSTLARKLARHGFVHLEADMWFKQRGEFDAALLPQAHIWCRAQAIPALEAGRDVVVSNTFIKRAEMRPYLSAAARLGVIAEIRCATGTWPSLHDVPADVFAQMTRDFEP
ncbi:MAG: ATP-binding protein [Kiritimatiellaeota bacterium]|nr:ATP-binding protein [Kiritimatiellota bacterium]